MDFRWLFRLRLPGQFWFVLSPTVAISILEQQIPPVSMHWFSELLVALRQQPRCSINRMLAQSCEDSYERIGLALALTA